MGQAYHRKRIPLGRGTKTRGVGIGYTQVMPSVCELTAADIAARRAERQKQQAAMQDLRLRRQSHINGIIAVVEKVLKEWKDAVDYNDQRLVNFAGWTTDSVCPFPVDEQVAAAYADELRSHSERLGRQLSVTDMDVIIDETFRNDRVMPTAQVFEEALKSIRSVVEKYSNADGLAVNGAIQSLQRRCGKIKSYNRDIDSAISFVSEQVFEPLATSIDTTLTRIGGTT